MVKRANGVVTTAGGLLGHVTSGPPDEIWKENNPFELDGERLYEAHDVSRALKALNLSWPEGLPESTTGGGSSNGRILQQGKSAGVSGAGERGPRMGPAGGSLRLACPPEGPSRRRGLLCLGGRALNARDGPSSSGALHEPPADTNEHCSTQLSTLVAAQHLG